MNLKNDNDYNGYDPSQNDTTQGYDNQTFGGQNYGNQYGQPNYGGQNYNQPYNRPIYTNPSTVSSNGLGMKWYKFIIYVQLFLAAVSSLFSGISYLTGSIYGTKDEIDAVYTSLPELKIVSIVTGVIMLVAAVIAIIARQKLAGFKHDGPMFYYITCGLGIASSLIYGIALYAEINRYGSAEYASQFFSGCISGVVFSVGLLIANIIYFGHRKDMFTN